MMNMNNDIKLPVSAFVIARREEDRIGDCLASLLALCADVRVIVQDWEDPTVAVAQSLGVQVHLHAWTGYGAQKRFGEDCCLYDWVLNLDADERISPELHHEIYNGILNQSFNKSGYVVDITDIYPGDKRPRFLAHRVQQIRLYRKSEVRFKDHSTYDSVDMQGKDKGFLRGQIWHYSNRSWSHAVAKANYYTDMQANDLAERQIKYGLLRLVIEFPWAFLKAYILRGHVLQGHKGLIASVIYAFSRFIRLAKLREKQR